MNAYIKKQNEIFENLFVLELANNHWGSLERGLKIIRDHATVVRYNNVKAAIKLQFRDVDEFIHQDFKGNQGPCRMTARQAFLSQLSCILTEVFFP